MGAILGTVAGWQRDSQYTKDNRTYEGASYIKFFTTKKYVNYIYNVVADIMIRLCDSPGDVITVTRLIEDIDITAERNILYPTGIRGFVKDFTEKEANELLERGIIEVQGLMPCIKKPYLITVKSFNLETKPLEQLIVTGVVYKILRMRARGILHIYGLTDKQFFERMAEKGYNKTRSMEMLKMFKDDRIKTKAKI